MKKIIILDFSTCEVHIYSYDTNIYEDGEQFLDENNFKESECQWMISSEEQLEIIIH